MVREAHYETLSLLGLRERAIRLWLAGIGLLAFGVSYISPMVLAATQPAVQPAVVLPSMTLPLVDFPSLAVPKIVAPRAVPAAATHTTATTTTPASAPAPAQRSVRKVAGRVVPQMGPPYTPRSQAVTRTRTVPVVRNNYNLLAPAEKTPKEKADPFAKAAVVEDSVGAPQSLGDTAVDTATTDVEDTTGVVPPTFAGAPDDTATGAVVEDTVGAVPTMDDSPAVTPAADAATGPNRGAGRRSDGDVTRGDGHVRQRRPGLQVDDVGRSCFRADVGDGDARSRDRCRESHAPPAATDTTAAADTTTATDAAATTETTTATPPPAATDTAATDTTTATSTERVTTITAPPVPTTATSSNTGRRNRVDRAHRGDDFGDCRAATTASAPSDWAVAPTGAGAEHAISVAATDTDIVVTVDGTATTRSAASVSSVTITGTDGADTLTIESTAVAIPITFAGGAGADTVRGPSGDSTWTISGAGAGTVGAVSFTGVENAVGAANNKDTFVFGPGGALAGTVDGGDAGFDTLVVNGGPTTLHASADRRPRRRARARREDDPLRGPRAGDDQHAPDRRRGYPLGRPRRGRRALADRHHPDALVREFDVRDNELQHPIGLDHDSRRRGRGHAHDQRRTFARRDPADDRRRAHQPSGRSLDHVDRRRHARRPRAEHRHVAGVDAGGHRHRERHAHGGAAQVTALVEQTLALVVPGRNGTDGVTNADTTFIAATGNFTGADVGKKLVIVGHGTLPPVFTKTYTVVSVGDSSHVTLDGATPDTATGLTWHLDPLGDATYALSAAATATIGANAIVNVDNTAGVRPDHDVRELSGRRAGGDDLRRRRLPERREDPRRRREHDARRDPRRRPRDRRQRSDLGLRTPTASPCRRSTARRSP